MNSLLRLIQTVEPWPCCILSVNSSSNSLFYYPKDWQAGTLSHTHTDRWTEGPIIIVSDFCAKLQLCQTVLDKHIYTHTHTHTHTHLRTPMSTAVGGKTAQPAQSSSNLTGIKWPLHRGSHMCVHACTVHAQTHTRTHNNNRGANECQTAGELDRKPSIYS